MAMGFNPVRQNIFTRSFKLILLFNTHMYRMGHVHSFYISSIPVSIFVFIYLFFLLYCVEKLM